MFEQAEMAMKQTNIQKVDVKEEDSFDENDLYAQEEEDNNTVDEFPEGFVKKEVSSVEVTAFQALK